MAFVDIISTTKNIYIYIFIFDEYNVLFDILILL